MMLYKAWEFLSAVFCAVMIFSMMVLGLYKIWLKLEKWHWVKKIGGRE